MTHDEEAATPAPGRPDIAIVGLACRYPDADDPASLLDVVVHGRRAFRRIPPERVNLADYYDRKRDVPDSTYSTRAALIEGWRFDRMAFGVSKNDYASTDPAHWLALETTARALAGAGFPAGADLPGERAGVFFGAAPAVDAGCTAALRLRWPYARRAMAAALAQCQVAPEVSDRVLAAAGSRYLAPLPPVSSRTLSGSTAASVATTICRHLGMRGGGYSIDAAGASSLAATVSACMALTSGDVDFAVAGGVDLGIGPLELVGLAKAGLLATGEVRVYDDSPTGLLPGEGCGVVLLMRAADARAAGLPVLAEISGWGTASVGQALRPEPDGTSHLLAMRRAHEVAGIDPAEVQFVEGAGTGDRAGDRAELAALAVLRTGARQIAAIGTISANIGHAGAAAGAAGLIKATLAIANGVLPPSTGVRNPHPLLRDGQASLRLPAAAEAWPAGLRHAAVSAASTEGLAVHLLLRRDPGAAVPAARAAQARPRGLARAVPARPAARARTLRNGRLGKGSPPPAFLTEPALRLPAARPAGRYPAGTCHPFAYLLHASDLQTMTTLLSRIRAIGPWLSDAELQDLAVLLARSHGTPAIAAAARSGIRIALVASGQEELAARAAQAMALLPELADQADVQSRPELTTGMVTRPGIFAAPAGQNAAGRIALILSGQPDSLADLPQRQLSRILAVLRWLDDMGVEATGAVGSGIGEIAGLVWAGCTTPRDARTLIAARTSALSAAVGTVPGQLGTAIGTYGTIAFRPGRRRLVSGSTAKEVGEPEGIAEILSTELFEARLASGQPAGHGHVADAAGGPLATAIAAITQDASLVVRTGTDQRVNYATGQLADTLADLARPASVNGHRPETWRRSRVPLVGIDGDPSDDGVVAPAAAALFVAGALTRPAALYAQRPSRPFDLWRDPVFITGAGQAPGARTEPVLAHPEPKAAAAAAPADQPDGTLPTPGDSPDGESPGTPAESQAVITSDPQTATTNAAAEPAAAAITTDTAPTARIRRSAPAPAAGARPLFRCYAEHPQRPSFPVPVVDDRSWRLHTGGCEEFEPGVGEIFRHDPAARRTLAVVGTLDRPSSRSALLQAAADATVTRSLVVISPGPGPAGLLATLHAEQPAIGITVLRAPLTTAGLSTAKRYAAAAAGHYRELAIGPDGTPSEPVLSPLTGLDGDDFPLGRGDVMVVSRGSGAACLVLAQVLACCDAAMAVVGRDRPGSDDQVIAGLEELRGAGARIGYELVSLSDHAALVAAIRRIEARFGRVTAIAHAGRALPRGELAGTSHAAAEREVQASLRPLDQIAAAVRTVARSMPGPDQLRLVVTSGSLAGRYGVAGEGATALGSAALADFGERLAAASPGCRGLHVDWPGWQGQGLDERPDLGGLLAAAGITALPVAEGARQLLKALGRDELPGRLAVHARAAVPAPRRAVAGKRWTSGRTRRPSAAEPATAGTVKTGKGG